MKVYPAFGFFSSSPVLKYLLPFSAGSILYNFFPSSYLLTILIVSGILLLRIFPAAGLLLLIAASGFLRCRLGTESELCRSDSPITEDNVLIFIASVDRDCFRERNYTGFIYKADERPQKTQIYRPATLPELRIGTSYRFSSIIIQDLSAPVGSGGNKDYLNYLRRQGYRWSLRLRKKSSYHPAEDVKPGRWIRSMSRLQALRLYLADRNIHRLGIRAGTLVNGLLLGLKKEIPATTAEKFRSMGLSHVLAVSGLHVAFLIIIFTQLVNLTGLPRPAKNVLLMILLILYAALTGFSASVSRTVIMAGALLAGPMLNRPYNSLNALAAAALLLLLISPEMLYDIGFQLSFAAVAGILLFYPGIRNFLLPGRSYPSLLRYSAEMLSVSIAASFATSALTLHHFSTMSGLGIILNIPVIPLTFFLMGSSIISMLPLPGFLSLSAAVCTELTADLYLRLMDRLSVWNGWNIDLSAASPTVSAALQTAVTVSVMASAIYILQIKKDR